MSDAPQAAPIRLNEPWPICARCRGRFEVVASGQVSNISSSVAIASLTVARRCTSASVRYSGALGAAFDLLFAALLLALCAERLRADLPFERTFFFAVFAMAELGPRIQDI